MQFAYQTLGGMEVMKIISKIVAVILFIVFFGFALKNTGEVTLKFFFGYEFPGPLVLILLLFFISGVVLGVFAMLPTVFRHRRELSRHKKMLSGKEKELSVMQSGASIQPQPDGIASE
jgi:uncharacterized integral membrane protein